MSLAQKNRKAEEEKIARQKEKEADKAIKVARKKRCYLCRL